MSEYDELLPDEEPASTIPVQDSPDEELPPTPEESLAEEDRNYPLAEREARKLARMTPEQKASYDKAQAQIMSHPAVAAFAQEEERRRAEKKATQDAFLAAYRKKLKG